MPERPRQEIESFANLVNEGLRSNVPQPASYWTAAFITSEGFRETVLEAPFQVLGVYLIAKAHETYGGRDVDTNPQQGNNFTFANATEGFATMIGLKACDQTYREFERQSLNPPKYGDVLNFIPHIREPQSEDNKELKSVKCMRRLWDVDTPPKPDQIDRLAKLNFFMFSLSDNVKQILREKLLFTHAYKAVEMGASPISIDQLMPNQGYMHHYNNSASSVRLQIQGHVEDFYTPEKAPTISRGHPILSEELIELIVNDRQRQELGSDVFRLRTKMASEATLKKRQLTLREKQRIADKLIGDSDDWERLIAELRKISGANLIPSAMPILADDVDSLLLQQRAHELLLTRDDMRLVNDRVRNWVIENQQPCVTGNVVEFMDHAFQIREESIKSNLEQT